MLKDIKYKGINTESNGYDATAGQLAVAHNVVNDHGYLETLNPPAEVIEYWGHGLSGYKCVFKHEMLSGVVNYIFYRRTGDFDTDDFTDDFVCNTEASLVWLSASAEASVQATEVVWMDNSPVRTSITTEDNLYEITAVGNTLCVLTAAGMDYFVWKNGIYKELGTGVPNVDIQFALNHVEKYSHDNYFTTDIRVIHGTLDNPTTWELGDGMLEQSNQIMGEINRLKAEATEEGQIDGFFYVRYALKYFDGTLTKHSSPVFMYVSDFSQVEPYVAMKNEIDDIYQKFHEFYVYYICHELFCKATAPSSLSDWKDIISGVEIYISKPQSNLDIDANITTIVANMNDNYSGATWIDDHVYSSYISSAYGISELSDIHNIEHSDKPVKANYCVMPQKYINVAEESLFYKVWEIGIDELSDYSSFTKIDLSRVLKTLVNQPIMQDDYHSHDIIIPSGAYAYNQRINMYGLQRHVIIEQSPLSFLQYFDQDSSTKNVTMYVKIDVDGVGKWIQSSAVSMTASTRGNIRYMFFADTNAKEIRLIYNAGNSLTPIWVGYVLELKQHPSLNGSYWFSQTHATIQDISGGGPSVSDAIFDEPNKVYTSEVGNPFYFPVGGINTVGTGKIIALASNVRAISQGQFGEFPLYVFTDSGIWMMEVDDKGLYKAKQPMSLDKVLPSSKVTSMDNAVAYVTERGLMLVSGSETRCISEVLDGKPIPMPEVLGGFAPSVNWETFKTGVACVYDSDNRRLHVYNPDYLWHYVYSVRTGEWTTMSDTDFLRDTISGHYVDTEMGLMDFNEEQTASALTQTIMTRPISFETDAYKRMRDNILRGDLDVLRSSGRLVSVLLQGSNDLLTWMNIGAVSGHYRMVRKTGTPYKWFRWKMVINSLPRDYKLHGMTADVDVTGNNKLR